LISCAVVVAGASSSVGAGGNTGAGAMTLGGTGSRESFFVAESGTGGDEMGALVVSLDVALVFFLRLFLCLTVFGIEVEVDAIGVLTLGIRGLEEVEAVVMDVKGLRDPGASAALVSPPLRIMRARGLKVDDAEDCIRL